MILELFSTFKCHKFGNVTCSFFLHFLKFVNLAYLSPGASEPPLWLGNRLMYNWLGHWSGFQYITHFLQFFLQVCNVF